MVVGGLFGAVFDVDCGGRILTSHLIGRKLEGHVTYFGFWMLDLEQLPTSHSVELDVSGTYEIDFDETSPDGGLRRCYQTQTRLSSSFRR